MGSKGVGTLSKAIRAALYACAIGLFVGAAVLAPTQRALAQPSSNKNVPVTRTGYALAIPPRDPRAPKLRPGPSNRPSLSPDPAALKLAKKAAADRAAASQHGTSNAATLARPNSVYNGTNFTGLTASGTSTPSDSTGAIGPNDYVEMVNSSIQVRDRSGNILNTLDLGTFGAFSPPDCNFDPQIAWDQQARRFLYSFLEEDSCNAPTVNHIDFGWSISSDPSDLSPNGWCRFGIDTNLDLIDYDKLGHDNHFINIGGNDFFGSAFQSAAIISINKPTNWTACNTAPPFSVFEGTNIAGLLNGDGTPAYTPVPADTADSSGNGYVVAAHNVSGGPSTKIMVWHVVAGAGGAPNLIQDGDVTVNSYGIPPAVPQPSTGVTSCSTAGNCLDTLDGKLTQAVAHFDPDAGVETIWTQHTVADGNPLAVERWYEIKPGQNSNPTQQGDVVDSGLYTFNGAVSPTLAGNEAVIFYNTGNGSTSGFADFRAQSRNSGTAVNTMTNETILAPGAFNTNDGSCGVNIAQPSTPCRWGDYAAARPDPMNSNAVWGTIMLTGSAGGGLTPTWSTQVAAYTPGCSTVAVTAPASAVDGSINPVTAVAAGCSSPVYAFYVQYPAGTGTWTLKQGFSSNNTWNWDSAGYAPGSYLIHVWANQAGDSTASLEALGSATTTLTAAPACTSATVSPPSSVQPAGATVDFTTIAATCPIPVFAYYIQDPTGTWTLKRAFSTDRTYAWPTAGLAPGHYTIHVWANHRGHPTASPEAVGVATADINICTGASLTGPGSNPLVGTVVTLTAGSTGCTNPQFEFFVVYPNGTRHLGLTWGTSTTFDWNTGGLAPGTYTVQVWANDIGDPTTNPEATASTPVTLIGCTTASASPDKASPQTVGATVVFTASSGPPAGCQNPVYEFWLLDPSGKWTLVQPWNMMTTWTWHTAGLAIGTYTIHVWANQANSDFSTFEANGGPTFVLQAPPPCLNAALAPSSTSQPAGSTILFTASSTGCQVAEYALYAQYPDLTWHLASAFGTSTTINWNTSGLVPGNYVLHLWASASGSGHDSIGSATVTLTGCVTATVTAPASAPAGTIVNMTGAGSAGCPNTVFEYYVQYPDTSWHLGRTWGPSAWGWNTSNPALKPGLYTIHAWTNQNGASLATYEAIGSATVTLTGCTMPTTVTQSSTTSSTGTPVTFTVTATTGCTTPIYEFWLQYPDMSWHEGQPFSTSNAWTWTPTAGLAKGTYLLHVWVNNQGADTSFYETIGSAAHTLT